MIAQVRPRELTTWLDQARVHGQPLVLDVREPLEVQTASIGAGDFTLRSIPMGSIAARLVELDPRQPVACLCHHGARSMQVASFLQSRGFLHVVNIAGGIHAWASELDPNVPLY